METTICRACGGIVHGDPAAPDACRCGHAAATPGTKVCCRCGKDLTGHTRYHDHQGAYWCRACSHADRHSAHARKAICEDCHKKIDSTKVDPYDGRTLCGACARERALDKSRPHRAAYRQIYDRLERRRTLRIVALCLLVVILVILVIRLRLV